MFVDTLQISLRLSRRSCNNLYVGVIYFPPGALHEQDIIEHICCVVDNIQSADTSPIITLLGDFNDLKCDSIVCHLGMTQSVSFPTLQNVILDKVFTNCPALLDKIERLALLGASDHCCSLLPSNLYVNFLNRPIHELLQAHIGTLRSGLLAVGTLIMIGVVLFRIYQPWIQFTEKYMNDMTNQYRFYFPEISYIKRQKDKPWITQNIKRLMQERQKALGTWIPLTGDHYVIESSV